MGGGIMSQSQFAVVPSTIALDSRLSPIARLTYVVLATYAQGGRGEVWPSQTTIADAIGVSDSTIKRAIVELRDAGAIAVQRLRRPDGSHGGNRYELRGFYVALDVRDARDVVQPLDPIPQVTGDTWLAQEGAAERRDNAHDSTTTTANPLIAYHRSRVTPLIDQHQQTDSHPTRASARESAISESGNDTTTTPSRCTFDEAIAALARSGRVDDAAERLAWRFCAYYDARGWYVAPGMPVRDWLALLDAWVAADAIDDAERAVEAGRRNRFALRSDVAAKVANDRARFARRRERG